MNEKQDNLTFTISTKDIIITASTTPTDANGGMPKYRKGPQRSERTTKDCKGTLSARLQEIGTN